MAVLARQSRKSARLLERLLSGEAAVETRVTEEEPVADTDQTLARAVEHKVAGLARGLAVAPSLAPAPPGFPRVKQRFAAAEPPAALRPHVGAALARD